MTTENTGTWVNGHLITTGEEYRGTGTRYVHEWPCPACIAGHAWCARRGLDTSGWTLVFADRVVAGLEISAFSLGAHLLGPDG